MHTLLAIDSILQLVGAHTAQAARSAGLRGKEWQILAWLTERGECSCVELARLTSRRRQEVQRSLETMDRHGLVNRYQLTPRQILWQIAAAGSEHVLTLRLSIAQLDRLVTSEFGRDLPQLIEWLERLREVLCSGRVTQRGAGFSLSPPPAAFRSWEFER